MRDQNRHNSRILALVCALVFWAAQPSMALLLSELMYHPVEAGGTPSGAENLEFIELYNNRAVFEDLSGCAFTNGIEYTFPPGTILAGKQYLVVAKDPAAVQAAYGITGVYGPFTKGKFNNDGERIELTSANGEIIISVRYRLVGADSGKMTRSFLTRSLSSSKGQSTTSLPAASIPIRSAIRSTSLKI